MGKKSPKNPNLGRQWTPEQVRRDQETMPRNARPFQDKRTKRNRTRGDSKRRAISEY